MNWLKSLFGIREEEKGIPDRRESALNAYTNGEACAAAALRHDRANNIEKAIHHYIAALQLLADDEDICLSAIISLSLGQMYRDRILGDKSENLEKGITHSEQALTVLASLQEPLFYAIGKGLLASIYCDRVEGIRAENLEEAIRHCNEAFEIEEALERTEPSELVSDHQKALHLTFAQIYMNRVLGDMPDNLEHAIHHAEAALLSREDYVVAGAHSVLGKAYSEKSQGPYLENLHKAVYHFDAALQFFTKEVFPVEWARTHNTLGVAYAKQPVYAIPRAIDDDDRQRLDSATHHYTEALQVYTHEDFPVEWAGIQNNLGNLYRDHGKGFGISNLEVAIVHYNQALIVRTRSDYPLDWAVTQNNLGLTFQYISETTGNDGEHVMDAYRHYHLALEILTSEAFPYDHQECQMQLGHLHFERHEWSEALAAFNGSLVTEEAILAASYTDRGRTGATTRSSAAYTLGAYCLLMLDKRDLALERMEQGKTRLLTETLNLIETNLERLPPAIRQDLTKYRDRVRTLEYEHRRAYGNNTEELMEVTAALRDARQHLQSTIASSRTSNPEVMPTALDLHSILRLIPEHGAVVVPLVTSQGSAVFVLRHGIETISTDHVLLLPGFRHEHLMQLLYGVHHGEGDKSNWYQAYGMRAANPGAWNNWLIDIGTSLWSLLLGEVYERLRSLGVAEGSQIIFLRQPELGILPLHAAYRETNGAKRYLYDDFVISYGPSAHALSIAQGRLLETKRYGRSLLAVVNPTFDLDYAEAEGEAVTTVFGEFVKKLAGNDADAATVIDALTGRNYVHFACHGFYDWQDPLRSGLVLAHRRHLTVADIIARADVSTARLVTLSACETGLTDIYFAPHEYLGLPAGFLQAGALSVISTLWPVNDLSTMLVMDHFYKFHILGGMAPANALRKAQLWLRDVTIAEIAKLFEKYGEPGEEQYQTGFGSAAQQFKALRLSSDPSEKPFANPNYWAAFCFSGY